MRLTQKATGGDQAKLSSLFGDMQVQQALRPLMSAFEDYKEIRTKAFGAGKTVDKDFAERMNDNAEKVKHLNIESKDFSITVGNQLLPLISSGSAVLAGWGNKLAGIAERHPQLVRMLAVAAAAFAALFLILGAGAILLAGLVAPVAVLGAAATALGIGLLPLIGIAAGVVAGIAALAAVSYWLYENWDNWPKIMAGIFSAIKFYFLNFNPLGMLMRAFQPALDYLRSINMADIGRWMIQGLIGGIKAMIPGLGLILSTVGNMIPDKIRKLLGIHSPSRVFAEIGGHVIGGLNQGLTANAQGPVSRINDLAGQMTRALAVGAGGVAMAAAVPAAAAPGAVAGQAPVVIHKTYQIKVEVAGGTPAQNIADAVRDAIRQIEREERGRGFGDRD